MWAPCRDLSCDVNWIRGLCGSHKEICHVIFTESDVYVGHIKKFVMWCLLNQMFMRAPCRDLSSDFYWIRCLCGPHKGLCQVIITEPYVYGDPMKRFVKRCKLNQTFNGPHQKICQVIYTESDSYDGLTASLGHGRIIPYPRVYNLLSCHWLLAMCQSVCSMLESCLYTGLSRHWLLAKCLRQC